MITVYNQYTSPSGVTLEIGETLCYPTYNGFEHKEAKITHIISHIHENNYYFCMSNGDMITDDTAVAAKLRPLSEE